MFKQQVAVLADGTHEDRDHRLGQRVPVRLKRRAAVMPVADARVGLPWQRKHAVGATALHVKHVVPNRAFERQ